jgi:uncharacterized membrane protein
LTDVREMELFVSSVLRFGVIASGIFMVMGIALLWSTGDASSPLGVLEATWIIRGSPFLEPSHVLFMGFLVLISTPLLRIMATTMAYSRMKDWTYAAITGGVLLILLVSITLGIG